MLGEGAAETEELTQVIRYACSVASFVNSQTHSYISGEGAQKKRSLRVPRAIPGWRGLGVAEKPAGKTLVAQRRHSQEDAFPSAERNSLG